MKSTRWCTPLAVGITAVTAAAICLPATAAATPPRDVEGVVIWEQTDGTGPDAKDYVFREITVAPGGSTGWHSHQGRLLGHVKSGILMHNRADCSMDGLYFPGQDITEDGGLDYVHIGRNVSPDPLVLQILYINPPGAPLSVDAPDPGCGFA
jgi:hypothetical protein